MLTLGLAGCYSKSYWMRKPALLILLAASLFIFSLSPVLAQSTSSGEPGGIRTRLELLREKREQFRETKQSVKSRIGINSKIASGAAGLRQKTVDGIKAAFENILSRFDAALLRLDNIANRMATRIDKLKAKGVDTVAAQAALVQAETAGANAKQAIDKAKLDIRAIDASSTTVKDVVHSAVNSVKAAKAALKSYQVALVLALRNLKSAQGLREGSTGAK